MNDTATIEPSRKEAKEQFDTITKRLGLRHTFSFEELYDIGMELRRRKEYRSKVVEFEQRVSQMEGVQFGNCFPLVHKFADGLYVRQITVPAQTLTVTKIHRQTHPFFILKGTVSILTEDGVKKITAPFSGITKSGTKRVIWHHDEVVLTTVHRTDSLDVDEIESEVTTDTFDGLEADVVNQQLMDFLNAVKDT